VPASGPRVGRGGRRPGAGRKPNYLKRLAIKPITAAEILAHRQPQSASLSTDELEALYAITRKLAVPLPDTPTSPPTPTLPEPFSLCDSEHIKVLSLNRVDDLSSHSKAVHRALCRHGNGATVKTNTGTIVAFIRG
jgi:hypothetical protein